MSKQGKRLALVELEKALEDADAVLERYVDILRSHGASLEAPSAEIEETQRIMFRLARDLTESAVRLYIFKDAAKTRERLEQFRDADGSIKGE